ncbi:hypothetical protein [Clostridium sp. B9]|uniref:hypothetical protein n=1 Tax=Clostridium sp. B9 TaxID=3423224 RepID=UPI003D2F1E0A
MKGNGGCMIRVLKFDDNFINCDLIKSKIPFSVSKKLIELYVDWDYKKEPIYDYLNNQCDIYPFITPYVENYFEDIIELLKNSQLESPKNICSDILDDYSNSYSCKNMNDINDWCNSNYIYDFNSNDDLFFELSYLN